MIGFSAMSAARTAWALIRRVPPWVWAILAAVAIVGALAAELRETRRELTAAELDRLNAVAAADSTTELVGVLGDSVRVFRRLAVQRELEVDRLGRELERESRVRARLTVELAELTDSLEAVVTVDTATGIRSATFERYIAPVHVRIATELPAPPAPATADVAIRLEPLELTADVGCGQPAGPAGVRAADLAIVVGGAWRGARVDVVDVVQDPEVCNAAAALELPRQGGGWLKPAVTGAAVGATLTATRRWWWPMLRGLLGLE